MCAGKAECFSDVFGEKLMELASLDSRICAITAAMPGGTGLIEFKDKYASRLFDVGIAEEHAVSMAGGLAKQGMIPVVALYSTFLQRAYDQIIQDVAILKLHVIFAVDRAGLVGEDGETHHGVFDVGFLSHIPGMTVLCPGSCLELTQMLDWSINVCNGPVAIRYPRGGNRGYTDSVWPNAVACHRKGNALTLITYGVLLENVMNAAQILSEQGIEVTVLRLLRISPLPVSDILDIIPEGPVLLVEETCNGSGIVRNFAYAMKQEESGIHVTGLDLGNNFVTHGSLDDLYTHCQLDPQGIARKAREVLGFED